MRGFVAILCILLFVSGCIGQTAVGLSSNVTTLCGTSCDWNTAAIWTTGAPPGTTDYVTLNVGGNYKLTINGAITIGSLDIGASDSNKQSLEITSGASLTITGTLTGEYSSIITVDAGASLTTTQVATIYGSFVVSGFVSIGGTGLHIGTATQTDPLHIVYGTLQLNSPAVVVVPISVSVSSESSIIGTGTINTTSVNTDGTTLPGNADTVGTLNINGDFDMSSSASVTLDIDSTSSFDTIIIGGNFAQAGTLVVHLLGSYVPLQHQDFIVFNFSDQSGGFSTIHGTNTILPNFLNKAWTVRDRTGYTMVEYGAASSVVLSFFTFSACILLLLL